MRATTRKRAAFALTLALTLAVVLSFPAVQPVDAAFVSATPNRWGPLPSRSVSHSSLASSAVTERAASPSSDSATSDDEPKLKTTDLLSLDSIRSTLIRQEETIIFALIERAQFRQNSEVYKKGALGTADLGDPVGSRPSTSKEPLSFLEYMLIGTVSFNFLCLTGAFLSSLLPGGQIELFQTVRLVRVYMTYVPAGFDCVERKISVMMSHPYHRPVLKFIVPTTRPSLRKERINSSFTNANVEKCDAPPAEIF